MAHTRKELIAELKKNSEEFSLEAMTLAVEARHKRRAKKNEFFNCFVLDCEARPCSLISLNALPDDEAFKILPSTMFTYALHKDTLYYIDVGKKVCTEVSSDPQLLADLSLNDTDEDDEEDEEEEKNKTRAVGKKTEFSWEYIKESLANEELSKITKYTSHLHSRIGELDEFLIQLKSNCEKLPNNTRFQVIYRSGPHWSNMDIVYHQGKMHFYLLDAAEDPSVFLAMSAIHRIYPEASIVYTGGGIQKDSSNCATFALDQAFRLSKLPNLHESLLIHAAEEKDQSKMAKNLEKAIQKELFTTFLPPGFNKEEAIQAVHKAKFVPLNHFPPEFGPLIRNMQSVTQLKSHFFAKKLKGSNKLDLESYLSDKIILSPESPTSSSLKLKNKAIEAKRAILRDKTVRYVETIEEKTYSDILLKRTNFKDKLLSLVMSPITTEKMRSKIIILNEMKQAYQKRITENPEDIKGKLLKEIHDGFSSLNVEDKSEAKAFVEKVMNIYQMNEKIINSFEGGNRGKFFAAIKQLGIPQTNTYLLIDKMLMFIDPSSWQESIRRKP
jgi:hypothetical protein